MLSSGHVSIEETMAATDWDRIMAEAVGSTTHGRTMREQSPNDWDNFMAEATSLNNEPNDSSGATFGALSATSDDVEPFVFTPQGSERSPSASSGSETSNSTRCKVQRTVVRLSKNVLENGWYSRLKSYLPRWTCEGLCGNKENLPAHLSLAGCSVSSSPSSYCKLEQAYLTACRLNMRLSDDSVANRIALIQLHLEYAILYDQQHSQPAEIRSRSSVGRGNASRVIDSILENIHDDWHDLTQAKRSETRAKFHERKKYGKRWLQLVDGLGPGVLLVCSPRVANTV